MTAPRLPSVTSSILDRLEHDYYQYGWMGPVILLAAGQACKFTAWVFLTLSMFVGLLRSFINSALWGFIIEPFSRYFFVLVRLLWPDAGQVALLMDWLGLSVGIRSRIAV